MIIKMFVKVSLVCGTSRWRQSTCTSILMGVIFGIALSLVVFPLVDEECLDLDDEHLTGIRSLQSDGEVAGQVVAVISDSDDYEPRLIIEGPAVKKLSNGAIKTPVRPRFYSTELGIREKLFVAVISHSDTVSNLGVAINKTLAHRVDKLVLFVQCAAKTKKMKTDSNSIVRLMSDVSVNQFPLEVLRYIGTHFAKDYDFFFVVDDSTYVRGVKLMSLAGHISVSQHVYMGCNVGSTRCEINNDGETNSYSQYCDYTSGILLSNSVLRAVVRDVDKCLHDQDASEGISEQIGRCVEWGSRELSNPAMSCQSTVQGNNFVAYRITKPVDFTDDTLKELSDCTQLSDVITVYPVVTIEQRYRVHLHVSIIELHETKAQMRALLDQVELAVTDTEETMTWPIGTAPRYEANDRFSVIRWEYLNVSGTKPLEAVIYPENDFSTTRNLTGAELKQLEEVIDASVERANQHGERNFRLERVVNVYRRYDPTRGLDYLLDLIFVDTDSGSLVEKRMEAVFPLGKVELVPMPYVTENTRIVLVLPVTIVDQESARKVLSDFTELCLEKLDNSMLVLVFLYDHTDRLEKNDIHRPIKNLVNSLNSRYHAEGAKLSWISVKTTDSLSSEFGVLDLVSKKFSLSTLFLVCKAGLEIRADYLNRVRMNTIAGDQVFFPIPFVQFHPDVVQMDIPDKIEIHKRHGHFAAHSFDHYAFYNCDYQAVRRLVEHEVPLARNDRDLTRDARHRAKTGHDVYTAFLRSKSIHVMRAVEPFLRVRYRADVTCQPELGVDSYDQCVADWLEGLASRSELASLLLDYESATRNT